MRPAARRILEEGWTVYKASKESKIPYSTLTVRLLTSPSVKEVPTLISPPKKKMVGYVIEMQPFAFGLSATEVGRSAFKFAKGTGRGRNFSNNGNCISGWDQRLTF
jgi:hypothetical protein